MLRKFKAQSRENMAARKPQLLEMLSECGDFYMELRWDFQSWRKLCFDNFFDIFVIINLDVGYMTLSTIRLIIKEVLLS